MSVHLKAAPLRGGAIALAVVATLSAGGCASFSPDGGLATVAALTRERSGLPLAPQRTDAERDSARQRSAELLAAQPLSADAAVELALLNHPGLRAHLAALGVAEADRVRAGRLRNPTLSLGAVRGGGVTEVDRALAFDLLGLLALPAQSRLAQAEFEQAQLQAAQQAVALAAEARNAWTEAVAAQALAQHAQQVQEVAGVADELARRMQQAGNFSPLEQLREQAFHAEAQAQRLRAGHQAVATRERLQRALGLPGPTAFSLPDRLPDLPAAPRALREAEQTAIDQRLDVQLARRAALAQADALGPQRATGLVNVLHGGYQDKRSTGEPLSRGAELELALPLFDFGSRGVAAEARYQQAVQHSADVALQAQSEVREAWSAYQTRYQLARHLRDELLPLSRRISEQQLLRYNGMLGSVFELLADARAQISAVTATLEAQRDFWLADSQLQTALSTGSPAATASASSTAAPLAAGAAHAAH